MVNWAAENGVQLFQDQEEANEFIIFLGEDGELQKTMDKVNGAVSDKADTNAKTNLGLAYTEEVIPSIVESGKTYLHEGQVYEDFRDLRPMQGDSEAVLDEKRKLAKEAVTLSQNANKAAPVGGLQKAMEKLQALHRNGIMFRDEGDFQEFLSSNGIFDNESRNVLQAKRKELQTSEGDRLNNYAQGVKNSIIQTFHPDKGLVIDPETGKPRLASIAELLAITDVSPLEISWINQIDAIVNDMTLAPRERAQKVQDFLRMEILEKAEKLESMRGTGEAPLDFDTALSILHNHIQVSRFINYNEYEGVVAAMQARADSTAPPSSTPTPVSPAQRPSRVNLSGGFNAFIDNYLDNAR
jgi:hypothetical protein